MCSDTGVNPWLVQGRRVVDRRRGNKTREAARCEAQVPARDPEESSGIVEESGTVRWNVGKEGGSPWQEKQSGSMRSMESTMTKIWTAVSHSALTFTCNRLLAISRVTRSAKSTAREIKARLSRMVLADAQCWEVVVSIGAE